MQETQPSRIYQHFVLVLMETRVIEDPPSQLENYIIIILLFWKPFGGGGWIPQKIFGFRPRLEFRPKLNNISHINHVTRCMRCNNFWNLLSPYK